MWRSWGMWRCGRTNVSQGKKSIGDGRDQQEMVLASFWHGCLHLCNFLCWNVADLTEATVFSILFLEQKDPLQGVLSVDQLQAGLLRALFFAGFSETFSHPGSDSKKNKTAAFFLIAWNAPHLALSSSWDHFFSVRLWVGRPGVRRLDHPNDTCKPPKTLIVCRSSYR